MYIEVSDTGVGMDDDTQRRCLEPFFTTKGERGTGLGLAMVYGMVQRHSAEIEIESAPGRGTTVRLVFSAAADDAPAPPGAGASRPSCRACASWWWTTTRCCSSRCATRWRSTATTSRPRRRAGGIEAFSRRARSRGAVSTLVITDLGMPYVDGRQVAAAVKELSPATPVILLTGWGQRLMADGDVPAHVDRVLSKPPKLSELRPVLAELLGARTHVERLDRPSRGHGTTGRRGVSARPLLDRAGTRCDARPPLAAGIAPLTRRSDPAGPLWLLAGS